MLANLSHYVCAALIEQTKLILAGNTSALGNSLPVTIFRASPTVDATPPPPHIWFEAQATTSRDELDILGNTVGQDSQGNQAFGAVLWGPMVDFGVRCRNPAERDDLFDKLYQAFGGMGINPTSGNRWIVDISANVGIVIADVTDERFATVETTPQGPLYEATASLVITTVAAASVTQALVNAVDINPVVVTVAVPLS